LNVIIYSKLKSQFKHLKHRNNDLSNFNQLAVAMIFRPGNERIIGIGINKLKYG
jgi:hypothetical protein